MTKIEWVKSPDGTQGITLNPIKGMCPMACPYCYARRMYKRFGWNPEPQWDDNVMADIMKIRKPTGIFLCSTFEWLWDKEWAEEIMWWIRQYPQHRFYLLTKRPEKLSQFSPFPDNCWVGVSTTNFEQYGASGLYLPTIKAKVKFISFEPLQGNIVPSPKPYNGYNSEMMAHDLIQVGINWVIIGAQTPYFEKTAPRIEWVKEIVTAADKVKIPVLLKYNLLPLIRPLMLVPNLSWFGNVFGLRQEYPA